VRSRITTRRAWAASVALLSASLVAVTGMPAASRATTASGAAVTTSSPAASAAPQVPADWPTYHGDNERTGVQSGLSPVRTPLQQVTSLPLDGAVYASPVVVHGTRIVATENDSV
jgi:polyvinyl alcohol dehydrogenase (cytochrome)